MKRLGSEGRPLRVAIVGAGPAGFYALSALLTQADLYADVDMFDRLPTPFGLVRHGVAPDHPKDKSVARAYERSADNPHFRFFGNIEYGRELSLHDLEQHYHQVIFATGADIDRRLGIPGEELAGCHAAAEFVAWYNGHPDFAHKQFDLSQENVAIVGIGNVALDVARMLCRTQAELAETDIADYALEALRGSRVRNIYVLGRRGPAQAAFTPACIRELGELPGADVTVAPQEARLDPASAGWVAEHPDKNVNKNIACIEQFAQSTPTGKERLITLRFFVSPVELLGSEGELTAVRLVKNEPSAGADGSVQVRATSVEETIPAGLLFRAVGYRGVAIPDVPFNEQRGVIENSDGRVIDASGQPITGLYAAGWIKRGASGVIGNNKACARETVKCMLDDLASGRHLNPSGSNPVAVERMIHARNAAVTSYADWQMIDEAERSRGEAVNRPRIKFTSINAMLEALGRSPD